MPGLALTQPLTASICWPKGQQDILIFTALLKRLVHLCTVTVKEEVYRANKVFRSNIGSTITVTIKVI